nr:hypothetical protein GCM10020093_017510 [Planobispora longispora]
MRIQVRQPCGQSLHGRRIRLPRHEEARRSVRDRGRTPDGCRMISRATAVRMADMDPELEVFVPLFPGPT